jgi:hypothetical protein
MLTWILDQRTQGKQSQRDYCPQGEGAQIEIHSHGERGVTLQLSPPIHW